MDQVIVTFTKNGKRSQPIPGTLDELKGKLLTKFSQSRVDMFVKTLQRTGVAKNIFPNTNILEVRFR